MTRFLLYLCHKLHTKMRKKYYNVFAFPLLSQFFEHTQCTAALCFWVLQNARQPWQRHQLRSSLWFQHCYLFFFYYTVPFSGWGWCGYIACCICATKKTTNGCQEWFYWFCCQGIHCQSLLKRDLSFYQMCSRTSEQQSCYSYLVYSSWSENTKFSLEWEAHSTTEFLGHILRSTGTCWDSELSHFFTCATPPAHNKQSQKSHSNREASLRLWTGSLISFFSFIYIVELSLRRW